jgi:hypothetical protein
MSYFDIIPRLLNASVKNVATTGNIRKSSNPNGAMITNANSPVRRRETDVSRVNKVPSLRAGGTLE